jgi:hypothetical protein
MDLRIPFAHSVNKNGTHDSICLGCFSTLATVRNEFEFARHEINHVCDPVRLHQLGQNAISRRLELTTTRGIFVKSVRNCA